MANAYGMIGGQSGNPLNIESITPSTNNQIIPKDTLLDKDLTIYGDKNLISSNIKTGTTLFNVNGSFNSFDESANKSVAFLLDDDYGIEYDITSFSDLEIKETAISGIVSPESFESPYPKPFNYCYFGKFLVYCYVNDDKLVYCINKTSNEIIATFDLSQYIVVSSDGTMSTSVDIIPIYNNLANRDELYIITAQMNNSDQSQGDNYIVIIKNGTDLSAIKYETGSLQKYDVFKNINDSAIVFTVIPLTSGSPVIVCIDTQTGSVAFKKDISGTHGFEKGTIMRNSTSYDSTNGRTYVGNIYLCYSYVSSVLITSYSINDGSLLSEGTYSYPWYGSSGSVGTTTIVGLTYDVQYSGAGAKKFTMAIQDTNQNWTAIFRHTESIQPVSDTNIWQKKYTIGTSSGTLIWDKFVFTMSANIAGYIYKIKAADNEDIVLKCQNMFSYVLDEYGHVYYSSYPSSARFIDTSVTASRTITTDAFTATIEEA